MKLLLNGGDNLVADSRAKAEILNGFLTQSSKVPRPTHTPARFEKGGNAKVGELRTI